MAIGSKASIPNAALRPFEILIGEWETSGSHPYVPDTVLRGRTSFEWIEGGAFVLMRSEVDHPQFPDGIAIFGSDDAAKECFMLYFDERGLSRKYDVDVTGSQITWRRNEAALSQRMTLTLEEGGASMASVGEMSRNGGAWEKDLSQTFTRVK